MATAVKEKLINLRAEQVRAVLDGRKTQHRVLVKDERIQAFAPGYADDRERILGLCPYGRVGDRLWVTEKWCICSGPGSPLNCPTVEYLEPKQTRNLREWESGFRFQDNAPGLIWKEDIIKAFGKGNGWRSPVHMPRWASRLTLEIVSVRVERLMDMTGKDVVAEGFPFSSDLDAFKTLWQSINGKESWDQNDWVWVISFRPLTKEPQ